MKLSNVSELESAIAALELKKEEQRHDLHAEFKATIESMKPMNLLRSSFRKIDKSHVAKTILKTAGGIGIGLLTNKFTGGTIKPHGTKSVIGSLVKSSVATAVLNNTDKIKAYSLAIAKNLFGNKKNTVR